MEDKETTLAELRARIEATLAHLKTIDAKSVDAAVDRDIVFPAGPNNKLKMPGRHFSDHRHC